MALIAEQIVEEWLRRNGYFTIRGLKVGVEEIDLLAVMHDQNTGWSNVHVEVQVSINPVTYITDLNSKRQKEYNIPNRRSAKTRTNEQLKSIVKDWVEKKYLSKQKLEVKRRLTNSDNWKLIFVHGIVKHPEELDLIKQNNIKIIDIKDILNSLCNECPKFTTGSATDIIDLRKF